MGYLKKNSMHSFVLLLNYNSSMMRSLPKEIMKGGEWGSYLCLVTKEERFQIRDLKDLEDHV